MHISWRLRHQAVVEGVSIAADVEFLLNPAQEVTIMESLQRAAGLADGNMALLFQRKRQDSERKRAAARVSLRLPPA